jgi:hypothetical protein
MFARPLFDRGGRSLIPITGGALILLQACSPCFGVVACTEGPHAAVDGRILVGETGVAVRGAAVTLFANSGSQVDSAMAITDASGVFELSVRSGANAVKKMSLRVSPIGLPGYTIDSLPCDLVTIHGDACVLDRIVPAPWVPYHALITYRNSNGAPVQAATVTFNRIGGATFFGPKAAESFTSRTGPDGVALLFPDSLYTSVLDTVFGDLVVDLPPPFGKSTRHGYVVRPLYSYIDRPYDIFSVGPSLDYRLVFVDSVTAHPAVGVDVQFQRTSGIATDAPSIHMVSDTAGSVRMNPRALATGILVGDLVVRPPGTASSTTISPFSLPTFDTDSTLVAARWRIGRTGILYALSPGTP